jgi:Transcriptional regulator
MRRTKAEAEQTREAVLDAAAEVFFEHGAERATLEQIARRAGVTRGAIYWHFKDKAEVLKALRESTRLPQEDLLEHALAHGHDDPLGLLETAGIAILEIVTADERRQRIHAIFSRTYARSGPMAEVAAQVEEINRDVTDRLLRIMQLAERSGTLAPSWQPETAARALQCIFGGLLNEWLRSNRAFSLVEVGTKLVRSLIAAMRA